MRRRRVVTVAIAVAAAAVLAGGGAVAVGALDPVAQDVTAPAASDGPASPAVTSSGPRTPAPDAEPTPSAATPSTQSATATSRPAAAPTPPRTLPPADAVLDYQIGGAYPPAREVGIVVRDRTERPAARRYGICYVNGFQTQPGELGSWPAGTLLKGADGRLVEDAGWPGEFLVDTRTARSRAAAAGLVARWIAGCARSGYKAVEIDNLDSWTRSRGRLTRAGNLAYARLLVDAAHRRGLAVGQKNAAEVVRAGRDLGFDFAIAEECGAYDECGVYTKVYGRRVFVVEYPDNGGRANFRAACAAYGARISVTYRDRDVVPRGRPGYVFEHC
jgi:hypothetical protein